MGPNRLYVARVAKLGEGSRRSTIRPQWLQRLGEHPLVMLLPLAMGGVLVAALLALTAARAYSPAGPGACFAEREEQRGDLPETRFTRSTHVSDRAL